MKNIPLALAQLVLVGALFATGQISDVILYEGKERALLTNPLGDYFMWHYEEPDFQKIFPEGQSTACWRGYQACWEIDNDNLYLTKVKSCHSDKEADLSKIIQEAKEERIKADWYSGILRIPDGQLLRYVHMGYGSTYERDILLRVDSGVVTDKIIHDTRPWLLKNLLTQECFRIPKVPFENLDIEEALDTIFELAVVYTSEEEHVKSMIKGLNIKYEVSKRLLKNKVNLKETNISLWDVLEKCAESIGGRVEIQPQADHLVIKIVGANQAEVATP